MAIQVLFWAALAMAVLLPAPAAAECCESMAAVTGDYWSNFSQYISGSLDPPYTGFTMEYGSHTVCANSKNERGACSGELTWPEAKQFCEEQGARLCSQQELFNDETHGSGCNYDYRLVWSSSACSACSGNNASDDSSYQVEWGYSKFREATALDVSTTGQECRAGTDTAYVRCCAASCDAAAAEVRYDAARAAATGSNSGYCDPVNDTTGTWGRTQVGLSASTLCPGSAGGRLHRSCDETGWAPEDQVNTRACVPPSACDVCECYDCGTGSPGNRPCGGAVGEVSASTDIDHFVDCSNRKLVVAPETTFPARMTRLFIPGNPWLSELPETMLGNAIQRSRHGALKSVYLQNVKSATSVPFGTYYFGALVKIDMADLQAVTNMRDRQFVTGLPVLATLIISSFNLLRSLGRSIAGSSSLRSLEIGGCPLLTLQEYNLQDTDLRDFKLIANTAVTLIPAGFFAYSPGLTTVNIEFNRQLTTLPVPLFSAPLSTNGQRTITVQGTNILMRGGTFDGTNGAKRITLKSQQLGPGTRKLQIDDLTFANAGAVGTLDVEGFDLGSATASTFAGFSALGTLIVGKSGARSPQAVDPGAFLLPGLHTVDLRYVQVSDIPARTFGQASLQTARLRCVRGVRTLHQELFSSANANLERISISEMPDLADVQPFFLRDIPKLEAVSLSHNPALEELKTNTFDGAFLGTSGQVRVELIGAALKSISRRTFNFDAHGISGGAVVILGSTSDSALSSCCGYHWLSSDPHFITTNLRCVNTAGNAVEFGAGVVALSDRSCCNAEKPAMAQFRSAAENQSITSFGLLTDELQAKVRELCTGASWFKDSATDRWVREEVPDADTMPARVVTQMYTRYAGSTTGDVCRNSSAAGARGGCPLGTRAEADGGLEVLDCEPWKHDQRPGWLTQHFVGDRACQPCGVLHCGDCNDDPRSCERCMMAGDSMPAFEEGAHTNVYSNRSGTFCIKSCYDEHHIESRTSRSGAAGTFCVPDDAEFEDDAVIAVVVTMVILSLIFAGFFIPYRRKLQRKKRIARQLEAVAKGKEREAKAAEEVAKEQARKAEQALVEFKEQTEGVRQVLEDWDAAIDTASPPDAVAAAVTSPEQPSSVEIAWFCEHTCPLAVISAGLVSCDTAENGGPPTPKSMAMCSAVVTNELEQAFVAQKRRGQCQIDSSSATGAGEQPAPESFDAPGFVPELAPMPTEGYASSWYWAEDTHKMHNHNPAMVRGTNWVEYAGSVMADHEARYWAWKNGRGPATYATDLKDRIASTGTESKVDNAHTGTAFSIDFEKMTQSNVKSGFARKMLRLDNDSEKSEAYHKRFYSTTRFIVDFDTGTIVNLSTGNSAGIVARVSKRTIPGGGADRGTGAVAFGRDGVVDALIAGIGMIDESDWAANAVRKTSVAPERIRVSPRSGGMCLPEYLQADDQVALPLRKGQLIEISKRNDDGWWYGALLYEEQTEDAKQVEDHIGNAGWFPSTKCTKPDQTTLGKFQASLGAGGTDALKPPPEWDPMPKTHLAQRFKVPRTSPEGKRICDAFHKTSSRQKYTITKLERIQNTAQWQSYAVKRIQIMGRNGEGATTHVDETKLEIPIAFHGSDQDTVPKIIQQGFNRSFCGKNAVVYGKGVYFARDSSYSSNDTYSRPDADGVKRMIVCKVLCGMYCLGHNGQLTPDVLDPTTNRLYDATVNNMANPIMWITYHDAQAYPAYLIEFKSGQFKSESQI